MVHTLSIPALAVLLASALPAAGCVGTIEIDEEPGATAADAVLSGLLGDLGPDRVREAAGVHHKLLLIDGSYAGARTRLVWTGTQDFTLAALRENDEVLLRVEDAEVHGHLQAEIEALQARGQPPL